MSKDGRFGSDLIHFFLCQSLPNSAELLLPIMTDDCLLLPNLSRIIADCCRLLQMIAADYCRLLQGHWTQGHWTQAHWRQGHGQPKHGTQRHWRQGHWTDAGVLHTELGSIPQNEAEMKLNLTFHLWTSNTERPCGDEMPIPRRRDPRHS